MGRIRTIKPEFFTSEDIVSLSPMARLLYIALWCEADREGRMAWKPKTFKMRYFPGDTVRIDALCKELTDAGLVCLYGDGLAHIPTFCEHQHINPRESASRLPDPRDQRVNDASARVTDIQVGKEGEGKEGKVLSTFGTCPPAAGGAVEDEGDEGGGSGKANQPPVPTDYVVPDCPYEVIVELYHERCPTLPRVEVLSDFRRGLLRSRWREVCADERYDRDQGIGWWRDYFGHVSKSRFLTGRTDGRHNANPFMADFEWLVRPQNFVKVVEGRYHAREAA